MVGRFRGRPADLDADFPGAVFPGAVLEHTGVAAPVVHPDQVVLFAVTAEPSP